jgi:hypothetical protein
MEELERQVRERLGQESYDVGNRVALRVRDFVEPFSRVFGKSVQPFYEEIESGMREECRSEYFRTESDVSLSHESLANRSVSPRERERELKDARFRDQRVQALVSIAEREGVEYIVSNAAWNESMRFIFPTRQAYLDYRLESVSSVARDIRETDTKVVAELGGDPPSNEGRTERIVCGLIYKGWRMFVGLVDIFTPYHVKTIHREADRIYGVEPERQSVVEPE